MAEFDFTPAADSVRWNRYAGRDVIPLWVADMDFPSPPAVVEALQQRIASGLFGYGAPQASLVAAVVDHCAREYGWDIDPGWLVDERLRPARGRAVRDFIDREAPAKVPCPTVGEVYWLWYGKTYRFTDGGFVERNARHFLPDFVFDLLRGGRLTADGTAWSYNSRAAAVAALAETLSRLEKYL